MEDAQSRDRNLSSDPKGLTVKSRLGEQINAKGRRVSDLQLALVNLEPLVFHGKVEAHKRSISSIM